MALEIEARHAAELQHQALDHDAETLADEPRIGLLQRQRRRDAKQIELCRQAAGDAPEIGELQACERRILCCFFQQQHHAAVFLIPLRDVIGDLGERLGGRNADRDRNASPLPHRGAQRARVRFEARAKAFHAEEGFVDRVDFEIGCEVAQHLHHARAHIAIERVIARAHDDARFLELRAVQMPRCAHGDAERLRLVAAGDHAAVVVREHDDGTAAQFGLKHALAGDIEIVAIDQGNRAAHRPSMRMLRVMTPHTSKDDASEIGMSG